MTCPRCNTEFDSNRGICPECGVRLLRNVTGVIRTSAVMIAAGEKRGFYRSVQEVPEPLRAQLISSTASRNSGTIVIADRAGKQQLTEILARRESLRERKAEDAADKRVEDEGSGYRMWGISWLAWSGMAAVLALAVIVSMLFGMRW